MHSPDRRDLLRLTASGADGGVSPEMLEAACRRIAAAGGVLAVWGVLREDVYETMFGDGLYLHLRGLALNPGDADRLVALAGDAEMTRWSVRPYQLCLRDGAPALMARWCVEEEFSINDFVEVLAEIPAGAAASLLLTGDGARRRAPGPRMLSLT